MALDPLTAVLEAGKTLADKWWPDAGEADRLRMNAFVSEFVARAGIVQAEAASSNWLASSWRPITMLTFVGLIVARWFGWAAPNLTEAEYLKLWDIVELGLGGYVIGRSVEKVAPTIADALKR